jgi:hypothetical protein
MKTDLSTIDRRRFLRGAGIALALPWFESFAALASAAELKNLEKRRRLACFYIPDGVPMPLAEDPAHADWSWFPHGSGQNFTLTGTTNPTYSTSVQNGLSVVTFNGTNQTLNNSTIYIIKTTYFLFCLRGQYQSHKYNG